jgi:hypothetical protein
MTAEKLRDLEEIIDGIKNALAEMKPLRVLARNLQPPLCSTEARSRPPGG